MGPEPVKHAKVDIDVNSLKELSDLGIDMAFLDSLGKITSQRSLLFSFVHILSEIPTEPSKPVILTSDAVQASLDQTSQLIGQLQKVQHARLSRPPPAHLSLLPGPSQNEVQLGRSKRCFIKSTKS